MKSTHQTDSKYRSLSFWHDTVPGSLEPHPALENDLQADVVIVGAGYTGLWTAYYLKQLDPGLKIAILESEIAGYGASGRNGGWCSAYLSGIDYWLDRPGTRTDAVRLQRLMFDTVSEVGRVAAEEGIDCHFEQSGTLEIAVNPGQLRRLQAELEYWRELGFGEEDYRWLGQQEAVDTLNVDGALAAIHMSHTAAIHPARLVRGLAETLVRNGVDLYENTPVVDTGSGYVATDSARVNAEKVIVATEGYSDSLTSFRRQLIPVHSMMVVTEPLDKKQIEWIKFNKRYTFGNLDHMVTYGQLTQDNRIAFGCRGAYHYGSGIRQFDPVDPEFDLVRKSLLEFFPDLEGIGFSHAWGGAMGVTRTLRPAVNFDTKTGIGWAGGFFGNGVGATNLAGRTMADLVTNSDTERLRTPWVNPGKTNRKWEPEPIRWLGYQARRILMQLWDRKEYL